MAKILKIKDSIVTITGKEKYKKDEWYQLSKDSQGMILSATQNEAQLLVVGDPSQIKINTIVKKIANKSEIHIYEHYFGNIISPFGEVIHGNYDHPKKAKSLGSSARIKGSPTIIERKKINRPLDTGIVSIDTMIPIGKGQRELIIGDRNTGKTSIALSAIINQSNSNVKSIYVAIGQKRNSIISLYNTLKENNALENTIVIFSNPDSAAEMFLAPTIAMAMAESLAYNGEDVLVVVDDLTKHANVYREISLTIGRNPGREAYPTDIFFQHSSLLERSGSFTSKYKEGSITCIPIVETIEGDLASLIPSNVISITDGQIFTSVDSFNKGLYPAINIQLSVSRTGTSVQSEIIRKEAKGLKAKHAELSEIKKFADLSIDISQTLMKKIREWEGLNNLLIQHGYRGYTREQIIILIRLYKHGYLEKLKNPNIFYGIFRTLCKENLAAKSIIKMIKENKSKDEEKLNKSIDFIFGGLINSMSNDYGNWVSQKDITEMERRLHE